MRVTPIALALILVAGFAMPANAANFQDGRYDEYLLTDWDNSEFDVLILPAVGIYADRELETLQAGVRAWDDGIDYFTSVERDGITHDMTWLGESLEIREYVVGVDTDIPPAALYDPEIVIISAEYNPVLLFGIGLASPVQYCLESLIGDPGFDGGHQHEQSVWTMFHADCAVGGDTCFVVNTNFLAMHGGVFTTHGGPGQGQKRMYDLNTHEFGHCLGVGHVGDALDFTSAVFPKADIMSYQFDPQQVHCVSSLNVWAAATLYADNKGIGAPASVPRKNGGGFVDMDPADYTQAPCDNPEDGGLLNL